MMKSLLLAMALLSLALASGCAKGGNGEGSGITVTVSDGDVSAVYPNQSVTFTAAVTPSSTSQAVTWSLSGSGCTGSGNPCGTIDKNSGVYVAPAAPPSPATVTITATSAADSTAKGYDSVTVVPITVVVTPTTVSVGENLVQQFTAIAVPDDAPQTFTWTCTPAGICGSFAPNPNSVAVYTAPPSNGSVTVSATSTVPQTNPGIGTSKVAVVTSRLPSGTYAFRFSGDDKNGNHVAAAGSFILAANGTITAGVEDVAGVSTPYTISSVSYSPISNNNNLGTLTVSLSGGPTNVYTAVLTSSGIIRMIESDGFGTGSGVMQKSSAQQFDVGAQTFAFGFTGVDSTGKRVGYVGMLPLNGGGGIGSQQVPGLLDSNDNGSAIGVCGAPPCSISTTSSYSQPNASLPTWWNMTLVTGATTQHFDFFVSAGTAQTKTAVNPLTLYAISTDPVDATHPALSGNMVYQVPMTYNNAAFSGTSVSNLTGANANVALIVGTTDGGSGGTGGAGGFTGTFDQNDDGTITSVGPTAPFSYTYVATSGTNGRYTFQMLGNTNPVVAPLPFVLYASGTNRGFLLDQNGMAVMTGSMDPQLTPTGFSYTATELPGTYAAATIGNGDSGIAPVVENLLLTSTGMATYVVAGTQNTQSGSQPLMGSYTLNDNSSGGGTGTITLTTPAGSTYVIYAIDATAIPMSTNVVIDDFMMMETNKASAIVFAQQ
jgi:hypothetical protein